LTLKISVKTLGEVVPQDEPNHFGTSVGMENDDPESDELPLEPFDSVISIEKS
jgi:hypothetical protein